MKNPAQLTPWLTGKHVNRQSQSGPSILFISGGSALTSFCHTLTKSTQNSVHLITTFDSGGSTAELRKHFNIPAIGDIRSRLITLANDSQPEIRHLANLLNYRFPHQAKPQNLKIELEHILTGEHILTQKLPLGLLNFIQHTLQSFFERKPANFKLNGASIGNLCLVGCYFSHDKNLDSCIEVFSELLDIKGKILPVLDDDYHLVAELESGRKICGQHLITGKEVNPIASPVKNLFLTQDLLFHTPQQPKTSQKVIDQIMQADLICYPPGSFYTSVIANLLVSGVAEAIHANPCPKVFLPNTTADPEQLGMNLTDMLSQLNQLGKCTKLKILLDEKDSSYPFSTQVDSLNCGSEIIKLDIISPHSQPFYDTKKVVDALLNLIPDIKTK